MQIGLQPKKKNSIDKVNSESLHGMSYKSQFLRYYNPMITYCKQNMFTVTCILQGISSRSHIL